MAALSREVAGVVQSYHRKIELLLGFIEEATSPEAIEVHFDSIGLTAKAAAEDVSRVK